MATVLKITCAILCVLFAVAPSFAGQKYVSATATGGGTGTMGSPWTIAEAGYSPVPGDTVNFMYSGAMFTSPLVTSVNGTATDRIVYRGYQNQAKFSVNAVTHRYAININNDYLTFEDLEVVMTNTLQVTRPTATNIVYVNPGADYVHIRRCYIHTDEDLWDMHAVEAFVHGIFQWDARYLLVEHSKIERTRFAWFVTGNALPRYTIFRSDTLRYSWQSAIDFQSPTGPIYVNQQILLEHSLIDSVLEEDGIQFEHDYTQSPYNGLLTPQHMGYVIRYNEFSRIAENAIDTKGGYKDIIFEHNIVHGVVGDDNGPFLGGSGGGRIEGRNAEDNNIQAAVQYHQVSSTGWHIMRFNVGYDIGRWNEMLLGLMNYNNTSRNVRRRHTGPNAPDDSLTTQYAYVTANDYGPGYVSYSHQRRSMYINNISTEAPAGHVYLTHSNDTLHINGNLYDMESGTSKNVHRNPPYTWPTYTNTPATSLSEWQTELNKSWYSNTTGKDANSLWDVDPLFSAFPANAYGSRYTGEIVVTSPAKNRGIPLTIVSVGTDQGNAIRVQNPYPFFAGFPVIGVAGDSIVWGGVSGWDQNHPVEITNIVGDILYLSETVYADAGDSVWLWRGGLKVNDIGAWQYGWPTTFLDPPGEITNPTDPGSEETLDEDTVRIDWSERATLRTIYEPSYLSMVDVQAHAIDVILLNPNSNPVRWDETIIWLGQTPALVPGELSWYKIQRAGDSLVGSVVGASSGSGSSTVEWRSILGDPRLSSALMQLFGLKTDTSAMVRLDTTNLAGADTTEALYVAVAHQGKLYLVPLPEVGTGSGVDEATVAGMIADSMAVQVFLVPDDLIGYATVSAVHDSLGARADDYAVTEHSHAGVYQPAGTYATPSSVADSLGARANDYADVSHNHTGVYQPAGTYATPSSTHDSLEARANDYATVEHNHTGVYQPAGTYATPSSVADSMAARANDYSTVEHNHAGVYSTPATVKDSLDARANDYSTVEHNHNSTYIAKTTKWVFTPQGFDSSLVYAGSVWPIYRGKNETVDSVFILTNGACNFQIQVYCGGTIGTPEDSLFSSPETVNTTSGQEVVTSFRNSGALGYKPWWLKILAVTSKPVSFLLELTGTAP